MSEQALEALIMSGGGSGVLMPAHTFIPVVLIRMVMSGIADYKIPVQPVEI